MKPTLAQALSAKVTARTNCIKNGNDEWVGNHEHSIYLLINQLPSGSGIDFGTFIDYNKTSSDKLVLKSAFHVMDDNGFYSSIIDYMIVVTPSLQFGINVRIIGSFSTNPDAYGLKEQLIDTYNMAFREEAQI